MESSNQKPLEFFKDAVSRKYLYAFVDEVCENIGNGANLRDNNTISWMQQDDNGEFQSNEATIESLLTPKLRAEFEKSKDYLDDYYINHPEENVLLFFRIQVNIIQNIINRNKVFLTDFKFFLFPLRGLVTHINTILTFPNMPKFELDESSLNNTPSFATSTDDQALIFSILNYMNGNNEKREQILNDADFALLIRYTNELVATDQLPLIERKIQPKITNALLSFSFWVLHKKLFDTRRIKPQFLNFLKDVFVNFENRKIESIKTQFGVASLIYPQKFIPEIILQYLEKSNL